MAPLPLALLLLRASRWFDQQVLDGLQQRGWPALTPAQSLVFAHLDDDGTTPSELARRLGQTRQSTSELVAGLVRHGLLQVGPNPDRRGGRLIGFTDRGWACIRDAKSLLSELETAVGVERAGALRALLEDLEQWVQDGAVPR